MKKSTLTFQVSPQEAELYRRAATRCGMKNVEWARHALKLIVMYGPTCPVVEIPTKTPSWVMWHVSRDLKFQILKQPKPYGKWIRERIWSIAQYEIEKGALSKEEDKEEPNQDKSTRIFSLRLLTVDKARFKAAAEAGDFSSLQQWIVEACNEKLKRQKS